MINSHFKLNFFVEKNEPTRRLEVYLVEHVLHRIEKRDTTFV
jgi:hypothetical protein